MIADRLILFAMNDGHEDMVDHLNSNVMDRPKVGSNVSNAFEDGATSSSEQLRRSTWK